MGLCKSRNESAGMDVNTSMCSVWNVYFIYRWIGYTVTHLFGRCIMAVPRIIAYKYTLFYIPCPRADTWVTCIIIELHMKNKRLYNNICFGPFQAVPVHAPVTTQPTLTVLNGRRWYEGRNDDVTYELWLGAEVRWCRRHAASRADALPGNRCTTCGRRVGWRTPALSLHCPRGNSRQQSQSATSSQITF